MSLKGVHLTLIALAVLLSALVSAWALAAAAEAPDGGYRLVAGAALACVGVLSWYWTRVRRKLAQW